MKAKTSSCVFDLLFILLMAAICFALMTLG
jgi:hypothetical protein